MPALPLLQWQECIALHKPHNGFVVQPELAHLGLQKGLLFQAFQALAMHQRRWADSLVPVQQQLCDAIPLNNHHHQIPQTHAVALPV